MFILVFLYSQRCEKVIRPFLFFDMVSRSYQVRTLLDESFNRNPEKTSHITPKNNPFTASVNFSAFIDVQHCALIFADIGVDVNILDGALLSATEVVLRD